MDCESGQPRQPSECVGDRRRGSGGRLAAGVVRGGEPSPEAAAGKAQGADLKLLPTRKLGRNGPMVPMLAMGATWRRPMHPG